MYLRDERETHFSYDAIKKTWTAWSNIPSDMRRLERKGWVKKTETIENGKPIDGTFTAPHGAISFRTISLLGSKTTHGEAVLDRNSLQG